jgi:curli production assembly/transport component CsgE
MTRPGFAKLWMLLLLLAPVSPTWAQSSIEPGPSALAPQRLGDFPEYGGVVTNQAVTSLGHFFHAKFTEGWNTQSDIDAYVLLVKERPSPRGGTEILVYSGDALVFRAPLPRSYPAIAALSESAVETAHKNAVETGLQALLFDDPDLARSAY